MREKYVVGVAWHGAELAMQERRAGDDLIYTFPGDSLKKNEEPAAAAVRVLSLQLGFPFSRESFNKVKVLRDEARIVSFYEVNALFGALKLHQDEASKMVLMSPYRLDKALQDDMVAELSAEYIGRYL